MQKINDLFGKRVISQVTGNQISTVSDIVLDRDVQHIVALVVGSGRHDEQAVRWQQILGIGEFVVVDGQRELLPATDDSEIVELRKGAEQITGKKVISAGGEQIGTVENMYFNRDGAIVGFELKGGGLFSGSDNQAIRAADVQAVGRDAVIVRTNEPVPLSSLNSDEPFIPGDTPARPVEPDLSYDQEVDRAPDENAVNQPPRDRDDYARSDTLLPR